MTKRNRKNNYISKVQRDFQTTKEPKWIYTIDRFTFFFSSEFNVGRFIEQHNEHRIKMRVEFHSRFGIMLSDNFDNYFDIIKYSRIEKRGFKVIDVDNEVVYTCLQNMQLDGKIKTLENLIV